MLTVGMAGIVGMEGIAGLFSFTQFEIDPNIFLDIYMILSFLSKKFFFA